MSNYLAGYKAGSQQIAYSIKRRGWAIAKGQVKARIAWWVSLVAGNGHFDSPFSQGFVDAHLDSLN